MKKYVSVTRSAAGKTTVKVSFVDGTLSSSYSVITYTGKVDEAVKTATKYALENMQGLKDGSEES